MSGKYMAYVGSYSYTGKAKGITVFDVDVENGMFKERCEIEVDNSSYVIASSDGKTLYSIADEGVVSFRILPNGSLARLNSAPIRGMRGCHLCTDEEDKYVFVSGYHDGKTTVLSLNPDGSVGKIVDGVFDRGYGSVAERNFRPHVTCTRRMPDNRFVLSVDNGIDQVKIYRFNDKEQRLVQVDAIRCELESAPRHFRYSKDGKFIYLMDAYEDLEKDLRKKEYNPFEAMVKNNPKDFDTLSKLILTSMMSECSKSFERLPILRHASIIRNILYSGVWSKYEYVQAKKKKRRKWSTS